MWVIQKNHLRPNLLGKNRLNGNPHNTIQLESLAGFLLLLVILNAADIVEELQKNFENLRQITEYRYCGLGTRARVGAKNRGGKSVMLGNDSLEVLQDRKEQECYC